MEAVPNQIASHAENGTLHTSIQSSAAEKDMAGID